MTSFHFCALIQRRYLEEAAVNVPPRDFDPARASLSSLDSSDHDSTGMRDDNDIGILNRQQLAYAKKQQLINRLHGGDRFEERPVRTPAGLSAAAEGSEELANLRGLLNPMVSMDMFRSTGIFQSQSVFLCLQLEAQLASGKLSPAGSTEEGTEQFNLAMINFLLQMKDKGHKINEKEMDMVSNNRIRSMEWNKNGGRQQEKTTTKQKRTVLIYDFQFQLSG